MGTCADLAPKSELQKYIPVTKEASIVSQAVGISGQAIQAAAAVTGAKIIAQGQQIQTIGAIASQASLQVTNVVTKVGVATATAKGANATALAASQAASKANFNALYASSRAASAATTASQVASVAGRALSIGLSVLNIVGTLATVGAVIVLGAKVAAIASRMQRLEQEVAAANAESADATNRATEAIRKADFAIQEANRATAKANEAINASKQAISTADSATARANIAVNKAEAAATQSNAAQQAAAQSVATSNEALGKVNALQKELGSSNPSDIVIKGEVIALKNKVTQLTQRNELQDSDINTLKVALQSTSSQLQAKEEKTVVRKVKESTVKNASGIRDLNGNLVGLESNFGQSVGELGRNLTQKFDKKLAEKSAQTKADIRTFTFNLKEIAKEVQARITKDINFDKYVRGIASGEVQKTAETVVNNRVKEYEQLNKQQATEINNKIDNLPIPSVAQIALGVAGLDVIRQIKNNSAKSISPCQAPVLVPPVGAQARVNAGLTTTLQGVTVAQGTAIQGAVTKNFNILSNAQYGLQAVQGFAKTAWKATQADKILAGVSMALTIHNAMMLSNNLLSTVSEATNMALDALNIRDETDSPLDFGTLVKGKITSVLTSILGQSQYEALTARIAKANRIYQSSINLLDTTRNLFDSAQSIAEINVRYTGEIGNALRNAGVVAEDAYEEMIEKMNPQSKGLLGLQKFTDGIEAVESAFDSVTQISSNVVEIQDNIGQLETEKTALIAEIDEDKKNKETEREITKINSTVTAEIASADFESAPSKEE